jgi:hypothetical protein
MTDFSNSPACTEAVEAALKAKSPGPSSWKAMEAALTAAFEALGITVEEDPAEVFLSLMPPRRALTAHEETLFDVGRKAVCEQERQHEAEGKTLPPFDVDRIMFRAGLECSRWFPLDTPANCPRCGGHGRIEGERTCRDHHGDARTRVPHTHAATLPCPECSADTPVEGGEEGS